jgi:hypothetical protein
LEQEYEGCIPQHYIDLLFSNAESLLELNIALFKELLCAERLEQSVGLSFMKVINLFQQYSTYCTNQRTSIETIQKLEKQNKNFSDFLLVRTSKLPLSYC